MRSIIFSILILSNTTAFSQDCFCGQSNITDGGIVDGVYIKEHVATTGLIPYEPVRQADVLWSKRVWSFIDVREKINHPLFYPMDEITPNGTWVKRNDRVSLWTILRCNALAGNIEVFSPYNVNNVFGSYDGDQLKYPVKAGSAGGNFYTDSAYREQLLYYFGQLGPESDVALTDDFGEPLLRINSATGEKEMVYGDRDTVWYTSKDIVQWRIKEDWFFDKNRSVLDRRIIAIAPVVKKVEIDAKGNEIVVGTKELFWVYFPHLRFVLNNYNVYNRHNDAQWMSFDALFWKRKFNSIAYKESNISDRTIDTYAVGIDALLESERIKEQMRDLESDVWQW